MAHFDNCFRKKGMKWMTKTWHEYIANALLKCETPHYPSNQKYH
jgi:hypothetical protein